LVEFLLDRGSDIDARDSNDLTALIWSSVYKNKRIVELLLTRGADINKCSHSKITCLHYSDDIWKEEQIQELIINKQPHNIKFFDDEIGILPQLKEKYKEMIELSLMGLFQ